MNRTGYNTDAGSCLYNTIDNLNYNYAANSNKLTSITDASATAPKPKGFNPGSGGAGFGYDLVGNVVSDTYKGITSITYNYLNLPESILWGTTKSILITYDASGNKLSKTVKTGATTNLIQDYVTGVEYNSPSGINRKIEGIYHAEGRYFNTSTTTTPVWRTEYSIKDHLGNSRISFADKNLNGVIDVTTNNSTNEILQENHYYAFGMTYEGPWMINDAAKDNPYQYNGKELNLDHGLNWSDYGARWYDVCLGRWSSVDPLAEEFSGWSPYNYVLNNPVKLIDPDGRLPVVPILLIAFLLVESHPASTPGSHKDHVTIKQAQDDYNKSQLFSLIPGSKQATVSKVVAGRVVNEVKSEVKEEIVSRSGAFNEAKRDLNIPKSQHPDKSSNGKQFESVPMSDMNGKSILGKDGKPIITREYTFTKPDGSKAVIQDHSAGHSKFGGEASKPHFNVRPPGNTRTGTIPGTKPHYPFLDFLKN